jgi:hypothetical protein
MDRAYSPGSYPKFHPGRWTGLRLGPLAWAGITSHPRCFVRCAINANLNSSDFRPVPAGLDGEMSAVREEKEFGWASPGLLAPLRSGDNLTCPQAGWLGFRMIGAAFPGGGVCWNVGGPARSGSSSLSCPRRTAAWLWHGGACCCSAAFCPRCFRSRWASWSRPSNGAIRSHPLSPNPNRHRSVVSLNSDMSITLFLWRCQDPGELLPATNYIKLPIQFSIRRGITRL